MTAQFNLAVETACRAHQLARDSGNEDSPRQIQDRLRLFGAGIPYREDLR